MRKENPCYCVAAACRMRRMRDWHRFQTPTHNNNSFFNPSYAGNTWGLLFWIFRYNNEYPTKYFPFYLFTMLHYVSKSLHIRTWVQISLGTNHSPTFHNNKGPSYSLSTLLAAILKNNLVLLGFILFYFILYTSVISHYSAFLCVFLSI